MERILLQTTIPHAEDDWHIGRFSLLKKHLESLKDENGQKLYDVAARNRKVDGVGNDFVLSNLNHSDFDQLWLFAVEVGDGLTASDCEGITKFRQRGGGIFSTRDHQDLGASLCTIGGVGKAHYFNSRRQDPRAERNQRDDKETADIDYPNYHSGANGDFQTIRARQPNHELLRRFDGSTIEFFPAHPHEGGVGKPENDDSAKVIATGKSRITGKDFNLIVAFENSVDKDGNTLGRAIAQSSFHHLVDYNWDIEMGCPSFLEEPPGNEYKEKSERLEDIRNYVTNLAKWLHTKR